MHDQFEQLLVDYEPMIYHLLSKYQVRDYDQEYYQELVITLWQASEQFESGKMKFSTFAYSKMQYRLIDLFRKHKRDKEHEQIVSENNKHRAVIYEEGYNHDYILLEKIRNLLTEREWLWFEGQIICGKTLAEIGREQGVKGNAVRHWKRKAVAKIQSLWLESAN